MLSTHTALVTGANSGIGLAITKELLLSGINVIAHYREKPEGLTHIGNETLSLVKADFAIAREVLGFLSILNGQQVDILVNNAAAYLYRKNLLSLKPAEMVRLYNVNCVTPVRIIQSVLPGMQSKSWGRVINISSISVKTGGDVSTLDYTSSKSALESITKSLSKEYARHNVTFNAIRPGLIDTPIHDLNPNKNMEERIKAVPAGRIGLPQEVSEIIAFLCSDNASFITGNVISVAGGE